jgi:hypothetical protein
MLKDVLWVVDDRFQFVESEHPDFLIFGPYGPPPPRLGDSTRIGYYCENIFPNMEVCDWAFGIPYEHEIDSDHYCRIEWHGIRPEALVKDLSTELDLPIPTRFCNFVFSNPVGFRENFFRALNCYKHVDAPGKSMNNRASFDPDYPGDNFWERKRKFLSQYKFTIAFENSSTRGYNTEKLTDPMLAGSIPIYFGNSAIGRHFNTNSFINGHDYIPNRLHYPTELVEALSREVYGKADRLPLRIQPRFRKLLRLVKPRMEYGLRFDKLIARIIEVDQDDSLYRAIRMEPFVSGNRPPSIERIRNQWIRIFDSR